MIDLSSDNVTQPTQKMREAMQSVAPVGYGVSVDQWTNRLEGIAAELVGKEAALLVPTGTQANLLAILSQVERSQEVIIGPNSHIYEQELGGAASIGGVMIKTWRGTGIPTAEDLRFAGKPEFRFKTTAAPVPGMVCFENSHNASGGLVINAIRMQELSQQAREIVPIIHLDGARIFNAAAAAKVSVKELCQEVDTVSFSLDKCLSAPYGAMLCGSIETIEKARRFRRMLGGYVRKVGILAAAGVIALETMLSRIQEDNLRAASLGVRLHEVLGISIDPFPVPTNLIMMDIRGLEITPNEFVNRLEKSYNVRGHIYGRHVVRLAVHRHIGIEEEDVIVDAVQALVDEIRTGTMTGINSL